MRGAPNKPKARESKAFVSFSDILKLRTPVVDSERLIMYANLSSNENEGLKALSSLLMAPLEFQYTAPALMNNFRSPLVIYGTESLSKRLMGSSVLRRPKQKNEP